MIRVLTIMMLTGLALWPGPLQAQTADDATSGVQVGDRWSYEVKDEISGLPGTAFTAVVTEISPQEVVTASSFVGKSGTGMVVYDHQWNRIVNGLWKYKQRDGHGVELPLVVGKEWKSEFTGRNSQNGAAIKATTRSKVTAQESITTSAGTFDTFKIEKQTQEFSGNDLSRSTTIDLAMWYAPQINHWVRRIFITKVERRLRSNLSEDLVAYGHKE